MYVDDILIAGRNESELLEFKQELKIRFRMKDLGSANEFVRFWYILSSQNKNYAYIKPHTCEIFLADLTWLR